MLYSPSDCFLYEGGEVGKALGIVKFLYKKLTGPVAIFMLSGYYSLSNLNEQQKVMSE